MLNGKNRAVVSRRDLIRGGMALSGYSIFTFFSAGVLIPLINVQDKTGLETDLKFKSQELAFLNTFSDFKKIISTIKRHHVSADLTPSIQLHYTIGETAAELNNDNEFLVNLFRINSSYGRWTNLNLQSFDCLKNRDEEAVNRTCVVTSGPSGMVLAKNISLLVTSKYPQTTKKELYVIEDALPHYLNAQIDREPNMIYLIDQHTRPQIQVHLKVVNFKKFLESDLIEISKLKDSLQANLKEIEANSLRKIASKNPVKKFADII